MRGLTVFQNKLFFNFVSELVPRRGEKKKRIQALPTKQDPGTS